MKTEIVVCLLCAFLREMLRKLPNKNTATGVSNLGIYKVQGVQDGLHPRPHPGSVLLLIRVGVDLRRVRKPLASKELRVGWHSEAVRS